jgi:hypothetical protein
MQWIVIGILGFGAHLSFTAIAPGEAGKASFYWPFAKDSEPAFDFLGSATIRITQLLSVTAGASFLAAIAGIFGWLVPSNWWIPLVVLGSASSAVLFICYIGIHSLIPLAIVVFLFWGVLSQNWTVASLKGG